MHITVLANWTDDILETTNFKAEILKISKDINLTIIPQITNNELISAAYVFLNYYKNFPKGTIHIMLTNNDFSENDKFLYFEKDGYHFIFKDNGFINLIFNKLDNVKIYKYQKNYDLQVSEIVREILDKNIKGKLTISFKKKQCPQPAFYNKTIYGNIIYLSKSNFAVSNISKKEIYEGFGTDNLEKKIKLILKETIECNFVSKIQNLEIGRCVGYINQYGYLEIQQLGGNIIQLMQLKVQDKISVKLKAEQLNLKGS